MDNIHIFILCFLECFYGAALRIISTTHLLSDSITVTPCDSDLITGNLAPIIKIGTFITRNTLSIFVCSLSTVSGSAWPVTNLCP